MNRKHPSLLALICIGVLAVSCSGIPVGRRGGGEASLLLSDRYYTQAMDALERRELSRALALLLQSLEKDPHNRKAKQAFERVTGNLRAEAVYTPQEVKLGQGLSKPLHYFLTYQDGEERYPVQGMPVRFYFIRGEGSLTGHGITDDGGIARCYVDRVDRFDESLVIRGAATVETSGEEWVVEQAGVSFTFGTVSPLDREQRVIVHFDREGSAERYRVLRGELQELFTGHGFTDVGFEYLDDGYLFARAMEGDRGVLAALAGSSQHAPVLLVGVERVSHSQASADFHLAVMQVSARYMDAGTVLFRERLEQRGAGSTEEEAGDRAFSAALSTLVESLDRYFDHYRRKHGV
ncbi:MAG: hypothetical protein ACOC8N_07405 [Spirochaetota bacterium]